MVCGDMEGLLQTKTFKVNFHVEPKNTQDRFSKSLGITVSMVTDEGGVRND